MLRTITLVLAFETMRSNKANLLVLMLRSYVCVKAIQTIKNTLFLIFNFFGCHRKQR